jgi:hypothetical protein
MFTTVKTTAVAAITALSLAVTAAAPAEALGRNERNFLKGVAAAVIVGAIINDAQARDRAPAPQPVYRPRPQPQPTYRPHPQPDPYYRPHHDRDRHPASGRVIGSSNSIHATAAAQSFNNYPVSQRRAIQNRLRAFGYYSGRIDGAFGPGTYRAVLAYARDSGGERQLESRAGSFGIYDSLIY